jgi:hypothetical protein
MNALRIVEIAKWIVLPVTAVIGVPPVASALFGVSIVDWRWVWNGSVWIAVSAVLFVTGRVLERRAARSETPTPPPTTEAKEPKAPKTEAKVEAGGK